MTLASAKLEQLPPDTRLEDARAVAALRASPQRWRDLKWSSGQDSLGETLVALVRVDDADYALSAHVLDPKQITVYGTRVGEQLDRLLAALAVSDVDVLDRVDREPPLSEASAVEPTVADVAAVARRTSELLALVQAEVERLTDEAATQQRKLAAAALEVGEGITERQRQTLALVRDGFTTNEIAALFRVSQKAVQEHLREGLKRSAISGKYFEEGLLGGSEPAEAGKSRRPSRRGKKPRRARQPTS